MGFEWDANKNRQNLLKHDVRFETAVLVFDDPYALTQHDESSDEEERWITLGAIGPQGASPCSSHMVRERRRGNHPYYFGPRRWVAREEKL